ncbi:COG1470 family protein [Streptomyces sp. NPDC000888]
MPYALPAARVLGLTLVLLGMAPVAVADDGWSVVPSASAPEGRPYVYAEGAPGMILQDSVSVLNPGAKPLTVRLRGVDADNTAGGGFTIREKPTDAGAWINFAGKAAGPRVPVRELSVRVPAHTRADVPFTLSVPAGASPGDHPGAIVASGDGARTSAVRIQLRVDGPTLSALTVEHVTVRAGRISYELVNRGTTALTPRLAVHADGALGEVLDRAPRTLPVELLPGRRVTLSEPWPDTPALDSVEVRLTVTAAGGARDTGSASATFVPWGAVAGAGGALAAVAAFLVVRRHRRRPPGGVRGHGHRTPGGEACEQPRTEVELTGAVS